jgi:hypothetical protein
LLTLLGARVSPVGQYVKVTEVAAIEPQLSKVTVDFGCSLVLGYELLSCRWAVFDVIDHGEIVIEHHVVLRRFAPSLRVQDEGYISSMLWTVPDVYTSVCVAVEMRD